MLAVVNESSGKRPAAGEEAPGYFGHQDVAIGVGDDDLANDPVQGSIH